MSALYPTQSVADCTVLITGATAGIGEAIAWRFAEAGAKLIICGRRTERLEALSAALVAKYPSLAKPHCATLDVQQLDKLQALPAAPSGSQPKKAPPKKSGGAAGGAPVASAARGVGGAHRLSEEIAESSAAAEDLIAALNTQLLEALAVVAQREARA